MAQAHRILNHQYLDDWLIHAKDKQTCMHHTQSLSALCQDLHWVINLQKSELVPQQVFNLVEWQYDLERGLVRPTPER